MKALQFWNPDMQTTQPETMRFLYTITGAKAITPKVMGYPVLTEFDATTWGSTPAAIQTTIDEYLGTVDEFNDLAFDSTSMGTDAIAFLFAMKNQCVQLVSARVALVGADFIPDLDLNIPAASALTNTSLTTQFAKGADGNIAGRAIVSGIDAATAGTLIVEVQWLSK